MDRETFTNILDLIAFLLVTPDLYGRANMEQLSTHLLNAPRPSLKLLLFWRRESRGASGIVAGFLGLAGLVSIVTWILAVPLGFYFGFAGGGPIAALKFPAWLVSDPGPSHWFAYKLKLGGLNTLLLMSLGEGAAFLIATSVLVWLFIFWTIGKTLGYIWATIGRLERIEGTMLAAGAVLFISARLLVVGPYLWRTLHVGALLEPLTKHF